MTFCTEVVSSKLGMCMSYEVIDCRVSVKLDHFGSIMLHELGETLFVQVFYL